MKSLLIACTILLVSAAASGCDDVHVGRQCYIESTDPSTILSTPAVECESRMCLRYQSSTPDMCTATCESDDDCLKEGDDCAGRFVCMIPVVVGPFACDKMCVCEDFFDGVVPPTPAACQEPL
jgi:hypothetical protein